MGDYGRWQLKVVLLLWIPMFFCGTQFVTTDFMNFEPKVLFCKDTDTCTDYDDNIFPSNSRSVFFNLCKLLVLWVSNQLVCSGSRRDLTIENAPDRYKKMFPEISKHFLEKDVTKMVGSPFASRKVCSWQISS